ncbi:7782_t:CDS:2 [Gigaspora margarita]|uniref:7782_t:CDS:1 n=1 Tax=Gigaspora margarita TaxID=4874 RepID=A0ABN7VJM4_GIGMA|nr:7782_t:CDS:2 [Gigaspora margarita]
MNYHLGTTPNNRMDKDRRKKKPLNNHPGTTMQSWNQHGKKDIEIARSMISGQQPAWYHSAAPYQLLA